MDPEMAMWAIEQNRSAEMAVERRRAVVLSTRVASPRARAGASRIVRLVRVLGGGRVRAEAPTDVRRPSDVGRSF